MRPLLIVAGLLHAIPPPSFGQPATVTFLGAGYETPADLIKAAPGQSLFLSLRGVRALPEISLPAAASITAEVVYGSESAADVNIQWLRQTQCAPAAVSCQPLTGILLQIPFAFKNGSILKVKDQGITLKQIALRRVEDAIHILNTCDDLLGLKPPANLPSGAPCTAFVGGRNGPLVNSDNPARGGDTLFAFVHGLGEVDRPYPNDQPHRPDLFPRATQPLTLNFNFAAGGARPAATRQVTGVVPAYAGLINRDGLYQINFTMPPVPPDLPQCSGPTDFNMTITLVGTDSADVARICAQ